jgi:hypothetical protein
MSFRVPEIFIIGTMKGGTTILYDYISTHPRVQRGTQKESHYFSMYANRELDWYIRQFPDRPEEHFSIDASPTYFDVANMPTIPAYIKKAVPEARIILIVRDPIERAISHFEHLRTVSHRELFASIDVNEFLSRPIERCYTREHPSDELFSYVLGFSIYDDKFSNYVSVFGRNNILVLTNDELRIEPQATMRRVFDHCGLEWAPSEMFGVQRYVSGARNLQVEQRVRLRLEALLYPAYERFRRRANLPVTNFATRGVGAK